MVLRVLGQKTDWVSTGLCSFLEARRENLFSCILQLLRATNVPRPTGAPSGVSHVAPICPAVLRTLGPHGAHKDHLSYSLLVLKSAREHPELCPQG